MNTFIRKIEKFIQKTNKKKYIPYSIIAVSVFGGAIADYNCDYSSMKTNIASFGNLGGFDVLTKVPSLRYGFVLDDFKKVISSEIREGEVLGDILKKEGVPNDVLGELNTLRDNNFDVGNLKVGNNYTILSKSGEGVDYFIYEPSPSKYVILAVNDNLKVKVVEKNVATKIKLSSGVVSGSLWQTLQDNGLSGEIIDKMEDALACAVDFHHVKKDDAFKLIYEQQTIEGKPIGVGNLLGCFFKSGDKETYAIYYEGDGVQGFYDLEGRPMKKSFLKAPLRFSRISSHFSKSRFHPVLKYNRPHFGTDYAAPHGTPILSVSDGTVVEARSARGNGNYVKIKHNNTYTTQYLHMSRFAKGIRPGTRVIQGQTIGYVGSTGWATGPHVCFRFWKNGKQVNHLNEKLPRPDPMTGKELQKYNLVKASVLDQLKNIPFHAAKVLNADSEELLDTDYLTPTP